MPGSGLRSSFGFGVESTYGTAATPNKFIHHNSFSIQPVRNRVQGSGIQSGVLGPLASHFVETTKGATASVSADVTKNGWGRLFEAITGGTSTSAAISATTAYAQAHTLGNVYGKSLTVQGSRTTRGGSPGPATLTGGKVTSAEFSCEVGGLLTASIEFDGQNFDNQTTPLATAVYTATQPWRGTEMCLKMGTFNSEANIAGVRSVSQTWTRSLDTEDYTACGQGLKAEPVLNGLYEISGSITVDWVARATFEDLSIAGTQPSLVWLFEGATIAAANKQTLKFTLPSVDFTAAAQGVDGVGELTTSWNYTWKYDGTNLPKIDVITSDIAL